MAVSSLASTTAAATAAQTAAATGNQTPLTQADFLNLLTTQMEYQDPMNPISATDFASQLAQFSTLQSTQQTNTDITQLLTAQQVTQGAGLIGSQVTYAGTGQSAATGSGVVGSVQISNGAVQLMVGNQAVPLSQVTTIAPPS